MNKPKKKIHCTNKNHLAAFNYAIEPDLEWVTECEFQEDEKPPVRDSWVDVEDSNETRTNNDNT